MLHAFSVSSSNTTAAPKQQEVDYKEFQRYFMDKPELAIISG